MENNDHLRSRELVGEPSSLMQKSSDRPHLSLLLHPSVPPMMRQPPPLSALHFFEAETDEEKAMREELGFGAAPGTDEVHGSMDQDIAVIKTLSAGQAFAATSTAFTKPVASALNAFPNGSGGGEVNGLTEEASAAISQPPTVRGLKNYSQHGTQMSGTAEIAPKDPRVSQPASLPWRDPPAATMDAPLSQLNGKEKAVPIPKADDSDSPIPELDSGSDSNFADDDDDEDEEDEA